MALATQTTTAAAGSVATPELTAEDVKAILVEPLRAQSVFLAAGPRIFDTAGPLRLPKNGGPITDPGWTGENEQIPERDVDFDEVKLLPSTLKSVKVITRVSAELARQSVINLDQAIRDRLVRDVADKLDAQFLSASGDGVTTPKGLFAYAGTQEVKVGGAMTLDHLLDAWGKALSANVAMTALKWVMAPGDFVALRKIKDTAGRYLLQADPTADGVFRVWGAPVIVTKRVPDTTGSTPTGRAALVDFSQIAVARDLAPSVKVLTERYADYDQVGIRVVARYDAAPLNPEAIVTLTGITR
ncbi:phage major capsid protein [Arsenicicoccus dermatophilus]|uniref:phage major capsid protein n=1 Tax=Arsenicicoccus dermatophilus TaxID=1076331 RepID=UPI001F4C5E49|nr:phage major capsid protein [Arsenicicoccus dermatophilus]MCH8612330.1 phage major capsid protein [Arsenicicoccus dermatophilus]